MFGATPRDFRVVAEEVGGSIHTRGADTHGGGQGTVVGWSGRYTPRVRVSTQRWVKLFSPESYDLISSVLANSLVLTMLSHNSEISIRRVDTLGGRIQVHMGVMWEICTWSEGTDHFKLLAPPGLPPVAPAPPDPLDRGRGASFPPHPPVSTASLFYALVFRSQNASPP